MLPPSCLPVCLTAGHARGGAAGHPARCLDVHSPAAPSAPAGAPKILRIAWWRPHGDGWGAYNGCPDFPCNWGLRLWQQSWHGGVWQPQWRCRRSDGAEDWLQKDVTGMSGGGGSEWGCRRFVSVRGTPVGPPSSRRTRTHSDLWRLSCFQLRCLLRWACRACSCAWMWANVRFQR
jgi:hypothetical protein